MAKFILVPRNGTYEFREVSPDDFQNVLDGKAIDFEGARVSFSGVNRLGDGILSYSQMTAATDSQPKKRAKA